MKHWKVTYSAKYRGGPEKKYQSIITAPTIRAAMDKADGKIITPMRITTQARVVVWKIEMVEDYVF